MKTINLTLTVNATFFDVEPGEESTLHNNLLAIIDDASGNGMFTNGAQAVLKNRTSQVTPPNRWTLIGYWQSDPESPECHVVDAPTAPEAIQAAEREANEGKPLNPLDLYINTFVFRGEPELDSSWAA